MVSSALDPAGPIFVLPGVPRLEIGDADIVDVIHTDPNLLGYPDDAGLIDYYPNSHFLKFVQPGCPSVAEPNIGKDQNSSYFKSMQKGPPLLNSPMHSQ